VLNVTSPSNLDACAGLLEYLVILSLTQLVLSKKVELLCQSEAYVKEGNLDENFANGSGNTSSQEHFIF
tara:strand:+ start:136 stop:342 length:207 start_codon:yes stop_codon:yes gene_type:complete